MSSFLGEFIVPSQLKLMTCEEIADIVEGYGFSLILYGDGGIALKPIVKGASANVTPVLMAVLRSRRQELLELLKNGGLNSGGSKSV